MPVFRAALKQRLQDDGMLQTLLPGGVFDADDLPQDGGGIASAPKAEDGITILPYAVLRARADVSYGPYAVGAEQGTVEVYVYQDSGYDVIEQAVGRIRALLHNTLLASDDRALAHLSYTYTSGELPEAATGGAACRFSRYMVVHIRK